jgi:heme oxygenase
LLDHPLPAVLKDLRAATAAPHRSSEERLPFLSPQLDDVLYRRLRQAYYGFYLPLEQCLDAVGALALKRSKVPALLKDLYTQGIEPACLECCDDLPTADDPRQCLGIFYVIEGATLGGQVLRRIVRERLGIDADHGGEPEAASELGTGSAFSFTVPMPAA